MPDPFPDNLPVFRKVLGEPVAYSAHDGADPIDPLVVIWSDVSGGDFPGPGNTTREVSAEIDRGSIAARPTKAARIVRKGTPWRVLEVVDRDDVDAWVVTLEQV